LNKLPCAFASFNPKKTYYMTLF